MLQAAVYVEGIIGGYFYYGNKISLLAQLKALYCYECIDLKDLCMPALVMLRANISPSLVSAWSGEVRAEITG